MTLEKISKSVWSLVLAGGAGNRLAALTKNRHGLIVPKQFCSLRGGLSLLEGALARAATIAPAQRTVAVVAEQHRRWWTAILGDLPDDNVVVQPQNRGTAHGILLPLLRIATRDPDAVVVMLPADHHVREEQIMAASLRHAVKLAQSDLESIYLLGIEPDEPDTEFGYIVPAPNARGSRSAVSPVLRFMEKPGISQARALVGEGALWNAFIMAASVRALLALFDASFAPTVSAMQGTGANGMDRVYAGLDTLDFSKDVLPGHELVLKVLPVPPCGWSDLGTPKRVAATLCELQQDEARGRRRDGASTGHAVLNLADQFDRAFRGPAYLPVFENFTAPSASKTL